MLEEGSEQESRYKLFVCKYGPDIRAKVSNYK